MNWQDLKTKQWTLFLDRDGTHNRNIEGDYVRSPEQFIWLPGALEALHIFSGIFWKIILLTNQQGIGKGLMTTQDLDQIHAKMIEGIKKSGGRMDAIYVCQHLVSDDCDCRKPKTGLALRAQQDFPTIDFTRSIMIGDKPSDIELGKKIGAITVFLRSGTPLRKESELSPDFAENDLQAFAKTISIASLNI